MNLPCTREKRMAELAEMNFITKSGILNKDFDQKYEPKNTSPNDLKECYICGTENINTYDLYTSSNEAHSHPYCLLCYYITILSSKCGSEDYPAESGQKCVFCDKTVTSADLAKIINSECLIENYRIKTGEIIPEITSETTSNFQKNWMFNYEFLKESELYGLLTYPDFTNEVGCMEMCPFCLELNQTYNVDYNCGFNLSHKCKKISPFMKDAFNQASDKKNQYCKICSRPKCITSTNNCAGHHYLNNIVGDTESSLLPRNITDSISECGGRQEFLARLFAVKDFIEKNTHINDDNIMNECAKYSQLNFKKYFDKSDEYLKNNPNIELGCGVTYQNAKNTKKDCIITDKIIPDLKSRSTRSKSNSRSPGKSKSRSNSRSPGKSKLRSNSRSPGKSIPHNRSKRKSPNYAIPRNRSKRKSPNYAIPLKKNTTKKLKYSTDSLKQRLGRDRWKL